MLYPNDEPEIGKKLRLAQQYFFVSCSLQDMMRIHSAAATAWTRFHESFAVQLNDTHPAIAVAELMRLLVDEHQLDWEQAWEITQKTFAYTNHTLLPEALENWPLPLFGDCCPGHLEIIYEINRRFLDEVRLTVSRDDERLGAPVAHRRKRSTSTCAWPIWPSSAATRVNGVAALAHRTAEDRPCCSDFHELYPEKFFNVTNGVTPAALGGAQQSAAGAT